jgi:hypothetical protein
MSCKDPALTQELSTRNDERTWFTCFIADRSWSIQTGREPMVSEDPRFLRLEHWRGKAVAVPEDDSIVALIKLRKIMVSDWEFQ